MHRRQLLEESSEVSGEGVCLEGGPPGKPGGAQCETRQGGVCRGREKAFAPETGGFRKAVGAGGPGAACGCATVLRERILNMETAGRTARGTDDRGNHSLQVTKTH